MTGSIALVFLVTLSGVVATYFYDDEASLSARLCAGACIGLTALGLVGFVLASLIGLTTATVYLTAFVFTLPFIALALPRIANCLRSDIKDAIGWSKRLFTSPVSVGYFLFYVFVTMTLWRVFDRAMIQDEAGIGTGLLNNFGDLPFHLSVITGFAFGNNFPPEDPTYSGVHFTYPFLSDFVSAIFVQCGADLRQSMFIENIVLAIAFVGLLHRWALVMLRDRLAAVLTPLLVLLNGGFGWVLLFNKANSSEQGLWGVLNDLPPSFTVIPETTWRWGNAISTLLVPQRGFLLGLPLAVIVFTQWWLAADRAEKVIEEVDEKKQKQKQTKQRVIPGRADLFAKLRITSQHQMIAAGVIAGMLPLVHAHSFVVVMGMGGCLALLQRRWRDWISFFVAATVVSVPQLLWSTLNSAVKAGSFFAWEVGWDHGTDHPVWFWFKNTGLFIPLIIVALLVRGKDFVVNRRLLLFYLPFVLCFIVPNFIKMAPWVWDNIKVLYYWWLASAPLVALLLAQLWRQGAVRRAIALVLFVSVTFAGALDVAGIALRSTTYGIFDRAGIGFAELVKRQTPPHALVVHAPVHNDPVFLTGRRSLLGYPGHVWTHGLEFVPRETEIRKMYTGGLEADQLLQKNDVDYVVIGPLEKLVMTVNEPFFSRYRKIGEVGGYALYKIKP